MKDVFKALADANRRSLLDQLRATNGQSLNQLCEQMRMSRQAVSKHLLVLEDAGLVVSRQSGRQKHHFLNPVPLHEIVDRWVSRFAGHQASSLMQLRNKLESKMSSNEHVCVIYIKASRETVWQGITSADFTRQYFHSTDISSTWEPGAEVIYRNPDGSIAVKGEVLEVQYPALLSYTWHVHYDPVALQEAPSRVTFELTQMDDATRLTLVHSDFVDGSVVLPRISEGWIAILSNLKTLLETDTVMSVS